MADAPAPRDDPDEPARRHWYTRSLTPRVPAATDRPPTRWLREAAARDARTRQERD